MPLTRVTSGGIAEGVTIRFGAGTVSTPSITFQNDTDTGIYKGAAQGSFSFVANGATKLTIDSTGVQLPVPVDITTLKVTDGSVTIPSITFQSDQNTGLYRSTADTFHLVSGATSNVTIKPNNVDFEDGIDVNVKDNLYVTKAAEFNETITLKGSTTASTAWLRVTNGDTTPITTFLVDSSSGNTSISGTLSVTENVTLNKNLTIVGSDTSGTEYFKVQTASNVDRFVVDSANGNTTISGTLSVATTATITTSLSVPLITDTTLTIGTTAQGRLKAVNASGNNATGTSLDIQAGAGTGSALGGKVRFFTSRAGTAGSSVNSLVETLTVHPQGNVGVGVSDPPSQYKFVVDGDINCIGSVKQNGINITTLTATANLGLILALS